jgi:AcrR family transcriptional regulator
VPSPRHLPVVDQPERTERADAARNRQRVLAAASRLFEERDPRTVRMDDVAKAAGVGRATLYRRYPSVGAIAEALLHDHEQSLQQKIIYGPPPLGPGAPPAERLAAFYAAMLEVLRRHAPLVLGTEVGQERYATGAYRFWRAHLRLLAREAGRRDVDVLADVLLAPLAPDLFLELRRAGVSVRAMNRTLQTLAVTVFA